MVIKQGNYFTVEEMAKKTGKNAGAVKMLLFRYGYKPVSKNSLYSEEAFAAVKKAVSRGRPAKKTGVGGEKNAGAKDGK